MTKVLTIEGMSCGHCKMRVEKALNELGGVNTAQVDLEQKTATVDMDGVDDEALKSAVQDAGYQVTAVTEG